jgi:hypothetical protein
MQIEAFGTNKPMAATIVAGATKTFKVLSAAGKPALAKKAYVKVLDSDGNNPISMYVHYRPDNYANATAIDVAVNYPLAAGGSILTVDFNIGQLKFKNNDTTNSVVVFIDAYGYEDMSGSTFA